MASKGIDSNVEPASASFFFPRSGKPQPEGWKDLGPGEEVTGCEIICEKKTSLEDAVQNAKYRV